MQVTITNKLSRTCCDGCATKVKQDIAATAGIPAATINLAVLAGSVVVVVTLPCDAAYRLLDMFKVGTLR